MGIKEELKEREKELDCLYRLTPLLASYEGPEASLFRVVEDELKTAMTYPEFSRARFCFASFERAAGPDKQSQGCGKVVLNSPDHGIERKVFSAECPLTGGDSLRLSLYFSNEEIKLVPREELLLESVLRLTSVTLDRLRNEKLLSGKNAALTELLNHLEEEKFKTGRNISLKVDSFIFPVLNRMEPGLDKANLERLNLVKSVLNELRESSYAGLKKLFPLLTAREIEICGLVSSGNGTKDIAVLLGISEQTVERHRCTIRKKLGLTNSGMSLAGYLHNL